MKVFTVLQTKEKYKNNLTKFKTNNMKNQMYRVKLLIGHTAKEDQHKNGYLGYPHEDNPIEYTRGEAIKKARMFGGKIEKAPFKKEKNVSIKKQKQIIEDLITLAYEEIAAQEDHNEDGGEFPAKQNTKNLTAIAPLLKAAPEMKLALLRAAAALTNLKYDAPDFWDEKHENDLKEISETLAKI